MEKQDNGNSGCIIAMLIVIAFLTYSINYNVETIKHQTEVKVTNK